MAWLLIVSDRRLLDTLSMVEPVLSAGDSEVVVHLLSLSCADQAS